jgi:hypothetical protein
MRHSSITKVALALLLAGCPAVEPIEEDNGTGGIPTAIQRIFNESCVGTVACHQSGAVSGLSLEPGDSAMILTATAQQAPMRLVDRGNVQDSYVAIKVLPDRSDARIGDLMPPPGQGYEISEEDRALLVGWIGGAQLPGGEPPDTDGETETGTDGETDTETEPMVQSCALEDIKPAAPNPIESGTGVGEIPPDIADALEVNCGCHYADPPYEAPLAGYSGMLDMTTWAGFQEEHTFALCQSDVAFECVQERLVHSLPMPPAQCVLEDGSRITDEDLALLNAWLDEGAPDGATWTP